MDRLTFFNETQITYDAIGNPLSYYNGSSYTFTWNGRCLTGAVKGSSVLSFTYNGEGIRTSKTVNGVTTTYYIDGSQDLQALISKDILANIPYLVIVMNYDPSSERGQNITYIS